MDLASGRRVVITGATSGIGHATAMELARRGALISIVCRNADRGKTTRAEIEREVPGSSVDILLADLSELAQVRDVAAEICTRYSAPPTRPSSHATDRTFPVRSGRRCDGRPMPRRRSGGALPRVRAARDEELQRRIWDRTADLVGLD